MKIVIDVADLDCERVDGTRVYIQNILKYLGSLAEQDEIFLLHKDKYNKLLKPKDFSNYKHISCVDEFKNNFQNGITGKIFGKKIAKKIGKVVGVFFTKFWWTQIWFAWQVRKIQPDVVWMPIQQIPFLVESRKSKVKSHRTKYVVTIHDLAFKFFPDHFPLLDRLKINFYTNIAIKRADKIIAISKATKDDIIKLYPKIDRSKVEVVYHGFDRENFTQEFKKEECQLFFKKYGLAEEVNDDECIKFKSKIQSPKSKVAVCSNGDVDYLLYVGAIQPRKDLVTLVKSFEFLKRSGKYDNLKLVLAGEVAWKSSLTIVAVKNSQFKNDIIMTGRVDFKELAMFYQLAEVFVFPSLYEGFGIPVLEAMASKTPVVVADNSSLGEIGGEAVLKFKSKSVSGLTKQIARLLSNEDLKQEMIKKGLDRIDEFSWGRCAKETLEIIKN